MDPSERYIRENKNLRSKVDELTVANLELQRTFTNTKTQCDQMYYEFHDLKKNYKGLMEQFYELKHQFEILQGKYEATGEAIRRQRQEFLQEYRPPAKKILKRVAFNEQPDVLVIDRESKGRKVQAAPSLEKYIRESGLSPDDAMAKWLESKRRK